MKHPLILPMCTYVFFMGAIAVYMFLIRLGSIRSGKVSWKYYRVYEGTPPPERILLPGQNYDNQFQVPILFLISCLAQLQFGTANSLTLILAWVFVFSRFVHAYVHLGSNHIAWRAASFAVGWIMISAMWVQVFLSLW